MLSMFVVRSLEPYRPPSEIWRGPFYLLSRLGPSARRSVKRL